MLNPIEKIMKEKNVTLGDIAKLADVSYPTMANLKQGLTKNISLNILKAIEVLGYNPEKIQKEYKDYLKAKKEEIRSGLIDG